MQKCHIELLLCSKKKLSTLLRLLSFSKKLLLGSRSQEILKTDIISSEENFLEDLWAEDLLFLLKNYYEGIKGKNQTKSEKTGKDYRRLCNSYSENIFKTVIQKINKLELINFLSKRTGKSTVKILSEIS